nr:hypothetical protein GCM10010200_066970 [Actinomadura rugatobispora]
MPGPGDDQRGEAPPDLRQRALQHVGAGAEEEHPVAAPLGLRQQRQHQIDPGDPFGQRLAQQPGRPHHRLAVGQDQVAAQHGAAQPVVLAQPDDLGGVQHPDGQGRPLLDGLDTGGDRLVDAQRVQPDPEEVPPGRRGTCAAVPSGVLLALHAWSSSQEYSSQPSS